MSFSFTLHTTGTPLGVQFLDPVRLKAGLQLSRIGSEIACFKTIGSTNDYARLWARRGAPDGSCVFAEYQTRGRGRRGRVWQSPPGLGILLSVVLRGHPRAHLRAPEANTSRRPGHAYDKEENSRGVPPSAWLPALGALAVQDAVVSVTGLVPELKWPNDVIVADKKLAGILAESTGAGKPVILGIGVNILASADPAPGAISLQEAIAAAARLANGANLPAAAAQGQGVQDLRLDVARQLILALDTLYDKWLQPDGPELISKLYRERLSTLGQKIAVYEHVIDEERADAFSAPASAPTAPANAGVAPAHSWEGVACDLGEDGSLIVLDAAGHEHRLTSGQASIRLLSTDSSARREAPTPPTKP